jgi:hypothetical protein
MMIRAWLAGGMTTGNGYGTGQPSRLAVRGHWVGLTGDTAEGEPAAEGAATVGVEAASTVGVAVGPTNDPLAGEVAPGASLA